MQPRRGGALMSTRRDYARAPRRTSVNWRGWALALCVAAGGLEAHAAECDGWSLEAGIEAHAAGLSAPDYTTPNPLGVVALRHTAGPWVVELSHTSSLQGFPRVFDSPDEDGYGINALSLRYRFAW